MTITPLRTRIEAILLLKAPTTPKQYKSFLRSSKVPIAIFCAELQLLLKPIYDLTRKGQEFVWLKAVHGKNFEEIKKRLCKAPVLHLPITGGRFVLYCDTSHTHASSAMWQFQQGTPLSQEKRVKTRCTKCIKRTVFVTFHIML